MNVAICNDILEFGGNRLADIQWSARFPGTGWIAEFHRLANNRGWGVASGDVALSHVQSGYWNATDVLVVQELDSTWAKKLLLHGARPLLLTCLESPLYAGLFFDELTRLRSIYPERMVPTGVAGNSETSVHDWQLRFPCYWQSQVISPVRWADRDDMVLIAANKYWSHRTWTPPSPRRPRQFLSWAMRTLTVQFSESRKRAETCQLHDRRLEAIEFFSTHGKLSLYGSGWDNLSALPRKWQMRLNKAALRFMGRADDKNNIQSGYRFALCFENVAYPGYITEKIIECFVAGVIPIYMGAPDITDFVPEASFIDLRHFNKMEELSRFLEQFREDDAMAMIEAGRNFLSGTEGKMHSHEGFADWVATLAEANEHGT